MKKDPKIFLAHILESILEIEKNVQAVSVEQFFSNTQLQDAVIRRLEIIGEAVKNLPAPFKRSYPQLPWKQMAGMRDVLIHEYFGVDLMLVWKVITKEIPLLKSQIGKLLQH